MVKLRLSPIKSIALTLYPGLVGFADDTAQREFCHASWDGVRVVRSRDATWSLASVPFRTGYDFPSERTRHDYPSDHDDGSTEGGAIIKIDDVLV